MSGGFERENARVYLASTAILIELNSVEVHIIVPRCVLMRCTP